MKNILEKNILSTTPCLKKNSKNLIDLPKIVIVAYNRKGCLRFSNFILWVVPNLAKYAYGWSSLEQYWKIEKNKSGATPLT